MSIVGLQSTFRNIWRHFGIGFRSQGTWTSAQIWTTMLEKLPRITNHPFKTRREWLNNVLLILLEINTWTCVLCMKSCHIHFLTMSLLGTKNCLASLLGTKICWASLLRPENFQTSPSRMLNHCQCRSVLPEPLDSERVGDGLQKCQRHFLSISFEKHSNPGFSWEITCSCLFPQSVVIRDENFACRRF